jgi:hypothetical protein
MGEALAIRTASTAIQLGQKTGSRAEENIPCPRRKV